MNITKERLAEIFDLWAARYAASPEDFGKVIDYGASSAEYFIELAMELEESKGACTYITLAEVLSG
jgi:hypothetical protein